MGIKIYISGISGNKEVKKRQQRVLMILESKNIKYDVIDIAEPGKEDAKEFMQNNAKSFGATIGDMNPRSPLPPQIFNEEDYCGDYDQFDMANEIDEIEKFLKLPYDRKDEVITSQATINLENGGAKEDKVPEENDETEKELVEQENNENKDNTENDDNKESVPNEIQEDKVKELVLEDNIEKETENDENGTEES